MTQYAATEASVRRALTTFQEIEPGGSLWRGLVGPGRIEVAVDVRDGPMERSAVTASARVCASAPLDGRVARALVCENAGLVFGRFRARDADAIVEQTILGGHTLDYQEVRVAAWAVAWAAGGFAERIRKRLAGGRLDAAMPYPHVEPRRGADERVAFTERRVEQLLEKRYGAFEHHSDWGYHGAFGSARVFCLVHHYLESSTAIQVASPVLAGVELTDELALEVHELTGRSPFGRFSYAEERQELWFEHAVLGDDLDADELYHAIDHVAGVADGEDDRLAATYGGRRYADLAG